MTLPLGAEIAFGPWPAVQTANGIVEVVPGPDGKQLMWRERQMAFPKIAAADLSIAFVAQAAGSEIVFLMIETDHRGNSCMAFGLQIIAFGPGWAGVSDDIGACRPEPLDIRVLPDRIEIDYAAPDDITVSKRTIAFDGRNVTETVTPANLPPPGAAGDPRAWVGRFPSEPFADPAFAARFAAMMTPQGVNELLAHLSGPGDPIAERAGWVVGRACMAHACGENGAWAIRIADGALAAAISGSQSRVWGLTDDPVVAELFWSD
jgi:hypothetical protein